MPYLQYQRTARQNDVTPKCRPFEWVHAQLHQQRDDKFITTDYLQQWRRIARSTVYKILEDERAS